MSRERTLKVTILGDASSAQRAMRGMTSSSKTMTGTLSSVASKARSIAYGVTAVVGAVGAGVGYALAQAAEAQKIAAQTEATLSSTHKAANITADGIAKLAGAIRDYSGIDDEVVQSGENILLTFTNIQNSVGKGNKIFNQATKVLADMSTALGSDIQSQAIQLGKALNDPVRGMSALRRVGVAFTEKQEKVINHLVKTGETAEAQRVILAELRKEFGGSARAAGDTFGGKLSILKSKLDDVAQTLGEKLMPVATRLVDWLSKNLPGAIKRAQKWLNTYGDDIGRIAGRIKTVLGGAIKVISVYVGNVVEQVQFLIARIQDAINLAKSLNPFGDTKLQTEANDFISTYGTSGSQTPSNVGNNAGVSTNPGKPNLRQTVNVVVNGRKIQSETTRRDILLGTS